MRAAVLLAAGLPAWPALAEDMPTAKVRHVVSDYGQCVVRAHHARARQAILSDIDNGDLRKHFPELIDTRCLGQVAGSVELKFRSDMYRYALAEALVGADFAKSGPDDFADRLPLSHLSIPDKAQHDAALANAKQRDRNSLQEAYINEYSAAVLSRYGECIARANPREARYWLLTPSDTAEENSRINALRASFDDCWTAGSLKFSRATMRGLVAINYYRLAMATPQPSLEKVH